MTLTLKGGPQLRARLTNLAALPKDYASVWAEDAADRMRRTKPHSVRPASSRFTTKATSTRAGVYGAFWWIFVDRGTKAHNIVARKAKALRFEIQGQTIFAKKVHLRRMARRPFISKAAQDALADGGTDAIIQSWNGKHIRGRKRFL